MDEHPAAATLSAKRRKVRKGTRSCWECKRRKIRCIFSSAEDETCIGCQRRRAPCVSQDLPEDLSPAKKGNRHLGERITRVEDFMKDFLASNHVSATGHTDAEPRQDRPSSISDVRKGHPRDSLPLSFRAPLTPAESLGEPGPNPSHSIPGSQYGRSGQSETEATARHHLWAAFPAEEDAKAILRESSKTSLYTYLINTQPHSRLTQAELAGTYPISELPGPNTHPIILAKRMILFAITLQTPCGEKLPSLSEPHGALMHRLMRAATTWITTKEEMHGTIETLVCIILEGVFEMNCGNLRRAWVVYRRAMTVAQLMGLHRSPMPPLKRIDKRLDVHPEFMWFRIVYMDRYLSLLLGLPQGTSDKSMGSLRVLQNEPPIGNFERLLTVIASRILERNESAFSSNQITITRSIDTELLTVSKSMPANFWRPANFNNLTPGTPDSLLETVRLAAQVYYYSLLIQLHLPYMMQGICDRTEHEYAKITCANASREILTRFIAHRSFNPVSSCSRPVDFFALLATMTLVLAHLDAHHHQEARNLLAHQRLSDCAIIDQTLERMDVIIDINKDVIAEKSAIFIRRLLDVEADAAEGNKYTTKPVREDERTLEDSVEKPGKQLRLNIPYLGVIKITRQGSISREAPLTIAASQGHQTFQDESSQTGATLTTPENAFNSVPNVSPLDDRQSLGHLRTSPGNLHISEPSSAELQQSEYDEQPMQQYSWSNQDDETLQPHMGSPPLTASVDDWTFQGVDMAFFDSLMRGMDPAGSEH